MSERLYRRKGGRVWYCWYYDENGTRRSQSTRCTDKVAARQILRRLERQATSARRGEHEEFVDVLSAFLDEGLGGKAPGTVRMHQDNAKPLARELGTVRLKHLDRPAFDSYVRIREQVDKISRNTISKEMATARMALRHAVETYGVSYDLKTVPTVRFKAKKKSRWLTPREYDRLIAEVPSKRRLWLMLAVFTGARAGEITSVRWQDIDLDEGTVHIRGTKTDGADRYVRLRSELRNELLEAGEDALPVAAWGMSWRDLGAACKRAGIEKVSAYDLRRTFATWSLLAGGDPSVVIDEMGHTSAVMIHQVYAWARKLRAQDTAQKVDDYLKERRG